MKKQNQKPLTTAVRAAALLVAVGATGSTLADGWSFRVGPTVRGGMDVEVKGPSKAAQTGTLAAKPSGGKTPDLSGGSVDGGAPYSGSAMSFDNGSVKADDGFGFAESTGGVFADGKYTFTQTVTGSGVAAGSSVSRRVSTESPAMSYDDDTMTGVGVRAEGSYDLGTLWGVDAALSLGFRGYWGMSADLSGRGYSQKVSETTTSWSGSPASATYTYTFDSADGTDCGIVRTDTSTVSGGVPGGSGQSKITGSKTSTWTADSRVALEADASLYQVAFDVMLGGAISDKTYFGIRPGVLLNVADVEIDRNEVFSSTKGVVATWHDTACESEFLLGFGLEACLDIAIDESWNLAFTAGYEFIDTMEVDVGPSKIELDFSGYTASVMIGCNF